MDETNPVLKQTILEVVNNQLENLDPPETKQTVIPSYDLNPAKKRGINSGSGLRSLRCVNHAVINKINPSTRFACSGLILSGPPKADRRSIKFATDEATFKRAVGLYESGKVTEIEVLGEYYSAKEKVFAEAFRVLKPGGRTVFCEIVLKEPLSENERKNIDDWFRCIGGALPENEFLALIGKVGFKNTEIISKCRNARTGHPLAICANIRAYKP